jgi:hypothetical protein
MLLGSYLVAAVRSDIGTAARVLSSEVRARARASMMR